MVGLAQKKQKVVKPVDKPVLYSGLPTEYYGKFLLKKFNLFNQVDSLIRKEAINFWPYYDVYIGVTVIYELEKTDSIQINQIQTSVSFSKHDDYYSRREFSFSDSIPGKPQFHLNVLDLNLVEHALVYEAADLNSKILAQREEIDRVSNMEILPEPHMKAGKTEMVKVKLYFYPSGKMMEEIEGWVPEEHLLHGYKQSN